jgi:hypothetical protein
MIRSWLSHSLSLCVLCVGLLEGAVPAAAQDTGAGVPLGAFIEEVAQIWERADVASLVALVSDDEPLLLDAGSGTQSANSRHAAAALRALFAEYETMGARAVRVTIASEDPPSGFGEIAWTFRTRGAPGERSRPIYVAARQQDGTWRISELRLMP